ncbi:MAG: hypothetical protein AAF585_05555 [Verrucomicrobiota bacterium]
MTIPSAPPAAAPVGPPVPHAGSGPLPESMPTKTAYPAPEPLEPLQPKPLTPPPSSNGANGSNGVASQLDPNTHTQSVPPFWFKDLGASVKGTSAVSTESKPAFETKTEPRQAPRPRQPRLEVMQLKCSACHSALTISHAHLNIEGACPTCGVTIVARVDESCPEGAKIDVVEVAPPTPAPAQPVSVSPPPAPVSAQLQPEPVVEITPPTPAAEPLAAQVEETPVLLTGFESNQPEPVAAPPVYNHQPSSVEPEPTPSLAEVAAEAAYIARNQAAPVPQPQLEPAPVPSIAPEPVSQPDENQVESVEWSSEPAQVGPRPPSRDPIRLAAGVMLVLVTCVLLVLAIYAPNYGGVNAAVGEDPAALIPITPPAPEPAPAAAEPQEQIPVVNNPPEAQTLRAQPMGEPIPPEAIPDPGVFRGAEPAHESFEIVESNHNPVATPAIVISNDGQIQRPVNKAELLKVAIETVDGFLSADSLEEKRRWILYPDEQKLSVAQFYTYEPLTSALEPNVDHVATEYNEAEQRWVSTFDIEMQATLPYRMCVVHQNDGTALVDFELYRQVREGSLHRYLTRSQAETSPVAPEIFRVSMRRIAYRDVRGRIDATLFHDPPILFEIGIPLHQGAPIAVPVSLESPIVSQLETVGWDDPTFAVVELQWQPSETNPKQPIPTISRIHGWRLWP